MLSFIETVGHGFDVRMEPDSLEAQTLVPGGVYRMRLKFLSPETAVTEFTPERTFKLWSGGTFGLGEVRQTFFSHHHEKTD
ncbi:hypothetical protein GCM10022256_07610 [Frondihabitans peucedani]|uniref:Uncharacterized protein n=1 Tax=Frondihabitans peucedani TaxID=598626 RepID=A0ABP8DZP6_9MICO